MDIPDVNVLINAFRSDLPHHALCRAWLAERAQGDSHFGISPLALCGFVRIVTNHKAFFDPNTAKEAFAFANSLLDSDHCVQVNPGERHWSIFTRLCLEQKAAGNLVPDAYFAAIAIEHSSRWVTLDRDYLQFRELQTMILA